jgi:chemotaxis protein MotB
MADGKEASIIIKKVKKGGHGGHHGGAWKVAYADFVTAMMAFFLLLWLLQATAQSQKEGIAEYFTPTIGVRDNAGIGFKGGKTNYLEGRKVEEKSPPGVIIGRMPQGPTSQKEERQSPVESTQDAYLYEKGGQHSDMAESGGRDTKKEQKKPSDVTTGTNDVTVGTDNTLDKNSTTETVVFEHAEEDIRKAMEEDPNFNEYKDNVIVTQTPEGMKIEIIDDDKLPMFESKGAQLTQAGEKILRLMADVIKAMPNRISITGHTEATNYAEPGGLYTNWELTADRANAARRFLMTANMEPTRVAKVVGRADQELLDPKLPTSARNRRVTIILLRGSYLTTLDSQTPAPQNLLTVPRPTVTTPEPPPAPAKPAPPPVKVPPPEHAPAARPQKTNVDSLSTEFKLPDALRQSINGPQPGAGGTAAAPAGAKENDGLNSLPSGLIKEEGQ